MSFLLSRRRVLYSALGAGLLAAIPSSLVACANDPPAARIQKTIRKTLHLGASTLKAAAFARAQRIEVRVGAKRYTALPHTQASRSAHAARTRLAGLLDVQSVTHFAEAVLFSAEGAQSYSAFAILADGREVLVGAGIHVATKPDRQRAQLGSDGAQTDDDPAYIMDDDDAAIWAVFNNPHVMSHDLDTAERVIQVIQSAPDYNTLRTAIGAFPKAREPEAAGYAGWVYGRYRTYKNQAGQTVYVTSVDWNGHDILDGNGNPARVIDWELSPYAYSTVGLPQSVKELAGIVTDQVIEAFNNQPGDFEGVKYFRYDPVTSRGDVDLAGQLAMPRALREEAQKFTFSAQDQTKEHRTLSVEPVPNVVNSFRVKVDNLLALGTMFGVSHFSNEGNVIQTSILGYAGSTYYPSLTFAKGWHSSAEAEFERPNGTFSSSVWTCSPAMNHGDYGPHGDQVNFAIRALVPWAMSILADIMLPGIFLSMGLIEARKAAENIVKETVEEAIKTGAFAAFADAFTASWTLIYGAQVGQNVDKLLLDMGLDFLKILIRLAEKVFLQGTFVAIVAGQLAQAGVETTLATSTPVVGWAIYAAEVALTGTQLVISSAHLIGSTIFTSGVVRYTHPVKIKAYPKDSSYFISSARFYKATVSASRGSSGAGDDFTPIVKTGAVAIQRDEMGREYFEIELATVPIVIPLQVQVTLFDAASDSSNGRANVVGVVAQQGIANAKDPGVAQEVEADVTIKPLPIDEGMGLAHDVILKPSSGAWTWSAKDAPVPSGDANPFQCTPGSLCGLSAISVRQTEDKPGHIAFNYRTSGSFGTSPIMADVAMAKSVADAPETKPVSESLPVSGGYRVMLFGLDGTRVIASQKPAARARIYVLPESASEVDLRTFDDAAPPYVTSRGGTIASARVAPDGRRLFLGFEDGVEVVALGQDALSSTMRATTAISRPGFTPGCISSCGAVAGFHHEHQFAVLDVGNYRVSVFDYDGAFVQYFDTADGFLSLDRGSGNQVLLDLDVDVAGNVWVLSQLPQLNAPPVPLLAVYGKSGKRIVALPSVQAERFALDRFNQVFSLNRQAVMGASGYASPTVSRWYPTHATQTG